jgi:site-specific DNA recombinase
MAAATIPRTADDTVEVRRRSLMAESDGLLDDVERLRLDDHSEVPKQLRDAICALQVRLGRTDPPPAPATLHAAHDLVFAVQQRLMAANPKHPRPNRHAGRPGGQPVVTVLRDGGLWKLLTLPPPGGTPDDAWLELVECTVERAYVCIKTPKMDGMTNARRERSATVIYCRISSDRHDGEDGKEGAGVERQEKLCRELAHRHGWKIAEAFIDNNRSASEYAKRPRPRYKDLLTAIRESRVARVLCYKVDRLYRQPRELQDLLDLAKEGHAVEIMQVHGGSLDLTSGYGQAMAEFGVSMAKLETRNTSDRIRDEQKQRRAKGLPNGSPRAFGWQTDGVTPDRKESKVLVKAMNDVLAGRSLGDIAREWNEKKVKAGRTWATVDVGRVLRLPRHAGLLYHKGSFIKEGSWTPVLPPEKWKQMVAILNNRSRVIGIPRRRSMLTNILRCGSCSGPMRRTSVNGGVKIWICPGGPGLRGCGHVSVRVDRVEPLIVDSVFDYVDHTDLAALIAQSDPDASARATISKQLNALDQREDEAASLFAAKKITGRMAERITNDINSQRGELEGRLGTLIKHDALSQYAGKAGALRRAWPSLSMDHRRAVISEAIGTVAIMPARVRGAKFDPSRIAIGALPSTPAHGERRAASRR